MSMVQSRTDVGNELSGRRIVLTAQRRAEQLASALGRHGAEIVHAPTLSVIPHSDDPELVARTRELIELRPDTVVVTTGIGFTGWGEVAETAGLHEEWHAMLAGARIVARGPKARGAIQAAGLTADWVAESETSAEIAEVLLGEGVDGLRIAVQHHGAGADGLDEALLREIAADADAVIDAVRLVAERGCDAVAFTSAPGAAAFLAVAEEQGLLPAVVEAFNDAHGVVAAAVGDVTAAPLHEQGIRTVIPERFRLGALARTLVSELAGSGRGEVDPRN